MGQGGKIVESSRRQPLVETPLDPKAVEALAATIELAKALKLMVVWLLAHSGWFSCMTEKGFRPPQAAGFQSRR